VEFSFDEPQLLGTAGAIKKALPLLGDNFFVLYGDSYLLCDYREIQAAFEESGRLALMTVFQNDGRWDRSNVELKGGQILFYDKKNQTPEMRHIDYGLGAFKKAAFQMVPDDQPYDLARLYQALLKRNELAAYEVKDRFYEVGSFAGLEEFRKYIIAEPIPRIEEPR
jgi:NDP-sugar pyrophosphorylase family protein